MAFSHDHNYRGLWIDTFLLPNMLDIHFKSVEMIAACYWNRGGGGAGLTQRLEVRKPFSRISLLVVAATTMPTYSRIFTK